MKTENTMSTSPSLAENRLRPRMILFDCGHTLLYERNNDFLRGERAVFPYITNNPRRITPEQACSLGNEIFEKSAQARKQGFEIHEWQQFKLKYEYLGITFGISYPEVERILWENVSHCECMPYVKEMLGCLNRLGIRSGVISNMGWSGEALAWQINRMLPGHSFECILASSDYGFRKPSPLLFELALNKAGLLPCEAWYCGDSIRADVWGADGVGIFPVLYEDLTVENPWWGQNDGLQIDCGHLHIHHWRQLIDLLDGLPPSMKS